MVKIPSTNDLSKAAVNFGHRSTKRHPKMGPYIQGVKNNIHIIDLEKTTQKLQKALEFLTDVTAQGGTVVLVGTKPAAKEIIKKYAQENNLPYVSERWIGGTLTNFQTISALIKKLKQMRKEKEEGGWDKYTKRERLDLERALNRLDKMVGGIQNLDHLPAAIYIVDIIEEVTALKEARKRKVPVVAIVDTNANPEAVSYPIPANDDAVKSIDLITGLVVEAIKEGREGAKKEKTANKEESAQTAEAPKK